MIKSMKINTVLIYKKTPLEYKGVFDAKNSFLFKVDFTHT